MINSRGINSPLRIALKHSKSISHDRRIPLPTDIGGDDLIRSVSSDGCDFTAAAAAAGKRRILAF